MTKGPCTNCLLKYKCEAERLACAQFRYFVNTSYISDIANKTPTRKIYADIFYNEPIMPKKKEPV